MSAYFYIHCNRNLTRLQLSDQTDIGERREWPRWGSGRGHCWETLVRVSQIKCVCVMLGRANEMTPIKRCTTISRWAITSGDDVVIW